jgi:hypothetical protein
MNRAVAAVKSEQGIQRVHELLVEELFLWGEVSG